MRFFFYTLGCKVNQAETASMRDYLLSLGHEEVSLHEDCDIVIINTCAVTSVSEQKSRQEIRKLRRGYPNAVLAVCGCLPQLKNLKDWEEIDIIGGAKDKLAFAQGLVNASVRPEYEGYARPERRRKVYLKIQDGCDNNCAYCIIPTLRGSSRSIPAEYILSEASRAYNDGFRELVLTGIELSSFKPSLPDIVGELCKNLPDMTFFLGSLKPTVVTKEFLSLSIYENLYKSFHLSIQSGSTSVIKRMGRNYTAEDCLFAAGKLRENFNNCTISGDIITGFPGETEEEHMETLEFIRKLKPDKLHVFPYSPRPGTKAADMKETLTSQQKKIRAGEIRAMSLK